MIRAIVFFLILTIAAGEASQRNKEVGVILTSKNTVILEGPINAVSVDTLIAALVLKSMISGDVFLVIRSPGGSIWAAYQLAEVIKHMPNVTLICDYCASAAAGVLEMTPNKRLMVADGTIMMHEAFVEWTAQMLIPENIAQFKQTSDEFNKIFYTRLGWSRERFEKQISNTQWYVGSKDALKLKLIDGIVKVDCDLSIAPLLPSICQ